MNDVIKLGNHRLLCGDATNSNDLNKLLDSCKVNLLLTDPPYGINIVKTSTIGGGKPATFQKTRKSQSTIPVSERTVPEQLESQQKSANNSNTHT